MGEATVETRVVRAIFVICDETRRRIAARPEELSQRRKVPAQGRPPLHIEIPGQAAGEHGRVRSEGPWRGGPRLGKSNSAVGQPPKCWRGRTLVAIEAHAIRPNGVQDDQEYV